MMKNINLTENKLNQLIEEISGRLMNKHLFVRGVIKGGEIPKFSEVKQVNNFILFKISQELQSHIAGQQHPWFDFENEDVREALRRLSNSLSKNIRIKEADFRPMVEKAVYNTLRLILNPTEAIGNFFFLNSEVIPLELLKKHAPYFAHYDFVIKASLKYYEKNQIHTVEKQVFFQIFNRIVEIFEKKEGRSIEAYRKGLFLKLTGRDLEQFLAMPEPEPPKPKIQTPPRRETPNKDRYTFKVKEEPKSTPSREAPKREIPPSPPVSRPATPPEPKEPPKAPEAKMPERPVQPMTPPQAIRPTETPRSEPQVKSEEPERKSLAQKLAEQKEKSTLLDRFSSPGSESKNSLIGAEPQEENSSFTPSWMKAKEEPIEAPEPQEAPKAEVAQEEKQPEVETPSPVEPPRTEEAQPVEESPTNEEEKAPFDLFGDKEEESPNSRFGSQDERPSLAEKMAEDKKAQALHQTLGQASEIKLEQIPVNKQFQFVQRVFGGSSVKFKVVLDKINKTGSREEAEEVLRRYVFNSNDVNSEDKVAREFIAMVRNRFGG